MLLKDNNPWLGLESYSIEDATRFYGRDSDVEVVSNTIYDNFITTIYGISGAGKTSLLNAGLTPELQAHGFLPIRIRLKHNAAVSYSKQIIDSIYNAIESVGGEVEYEIDLRIEDIPENEKLWFFLHTRKFWSDKNYPIKPVIFIDQFEEIFTQNEEMQVVSEFFNSVNAIQFDAPPACTKQLLDDCSEYQDLHDNNSRIVFIIREDFLARLEDYAYGIAALRRNRIGVKRMNGLQALEVIMRPVPGLISREGALRILSKVSGKDVNDSLYSLERLSIDTSILSLFCSELYQRACEEDSNAIYERIIEEFGNDIIYQFYKDNMSQISPKIVEYIEKHLLTSSGFRNSVAFEDIEINNVSREKIDSSFLFLAKKRILRIEDYEGVERVEFTHDVLCKVAKHHRDSRRESQQQKKDNRKSWVRCIDFIVLVFISGLILSYGSSPLWDLSLLKSLTPEWVSSVLIFSYLFLTKDSEDNKYWKLLGTFFIATVFLNPIALLTSSYACVIPILILSCTTVLAYYSFVAQYHKSGLLRRFLFVVLLLLAVHYSVQALLATLVLLSLLVLTPYKFSEDVNACVFCSAASFILILIMVLYDIDGLPFALYPLSVFFSKRKKTSKTISESFQSCLKCEVYDSYPIFKYILLSVFILYLLMMCGKYGASMEDMNVYYVPFVSALMFCVLYELLRVSYGRFKEITEKNREARLLMGALLSGGASMLMMLSQYVPFGIVLMIIILIFTYAFLRLGPLSLQGSEQDVKSRAWSSVIIMISLFLVPLSCIGYPVYRHCRYAKVPFKSFEIKELMLVRDAEGNYGVRDRYDMIVPVSYLKDIEMTASATGYIPLYRHWTKLRYIVNKPTSALSEFLYRQREITYYGSRPDENSTPVPNIVFTMKKPVTGESVTWDCGKHLNERNICTSIIVESAGTILDNDRYNEAYADECAGILESAGKNASDYAKRHLFNCFKRYLSSDYEIYDLDDVRENLLKFTPDNIEAAVAGSGRLLKYIDDVEYVNFILDTLYSRCFKEDWPSYEKWEYYSKVADYYLSADIWDKALEYADIAISQDTTLKYAYKYKILADVFAEKYEEAGELLDLYGDGMHYQGTIYNDITYVEERIIYRQSDSTSVLLRYDNLRNAVANSLKCYESAGLIGDPESPDYKSFKKMLYVDPTVGTYDSAEDKGSYYLCRKYYDYDGPGGEFRDRWTWNDVLDYQFYMSEDGTVSPPFKRYAEGVDEDIMVIIEEDSHIRRYIDRTGDGFSVIEGEFDHAWRFSDGLAAVVVDDKIGFIDRNGDYVIEPSFDYWHIPPGDDEEGRYISRSYNLPSSKIVDLVFQNGLCPMWQGTGLSGLINKKGEWFIEPQYDNIIFDSDLGLWILKKNVNGKNLWGAIDKNGRMVMDVEYDQVLYSPDVGPMWGKDGVYSIINDDKIEILVLIEENGPDRLFRNQDGELIVYPDIFNYVDSALI